MNVLPGGGFAAAVLFGAVVIWFHAWNQFNRPSYTESSDFTRIMKRLQPSDMRKGPVYIQAYIIYALILTFIYLLICIYASVPFLQGLITIDIPGLDLPGGTAGAQKLPNSAVLSTGAAFDDAELGAVGGDDGPSPTLPLLVSLAVVGLAPNVPFLARIEEWIRSRSHRLSGIPTHLIDTGFKLRRERLFDPKQGKGLLISEEEWQQADSYFKAAGTYASREREALRENVLKIIALRNWFLRGRLFQPDGTTRYTYQHLETEVRQEIRDLLAKLDSLSARQAAKGDDETAERNLEWADVVKSTEEVCGDVCVLVALYSERDAFAADMKEARARPDSTDDSYRKERQVAADTFMDAHRRVSLVADQDSFGTTIFFRLTGSIVLVAVLAGLMLGEERLSSSSQVGSIVLAFKYGVTAAIMYALPLFVALGYQQESLKHDRWSNIVDGRRSQAVSQYVFTFIAATLIALAGLISNNIYFAISDVGLETVADRFPEVLLAAYRVEGYRALMGGTLACCIALTIDAWRAGKLTGWFASPWPLFLVGLTTILLTSLGAWEIYQGFVIGEIEVEWEKVRRQARIQGLVGLIASVYVVQSLMEELSDPRKRRIHA